MHLKLIGCAVFEREVRAVVACCLNRVDMEWVDTDPHHFSEEELAIKFQCRIDAAAPAGYHAVLLVAGSCTRGLSGLQARSIPLVLPRVKDCISLLLDHPVAPPGPPPQALSPAGWQFRPRTPRLLDSQNTSSEPKASFWVVPVADSPAPVEPTHTDWKWRRAFTHPRSCARQLRAPPRFHRRCVKSAPSHCSTDLGSSAETGSGSLLKRLVDGYWSYADFVVVPPGWRLRRDEQGILGAEEPNP